MKTTVLLIIAILCHAAVYAGGSPTVEPTPAKVPPQTGQQSISSEQGRFSLELVPGVNELQIGPNSLDLVLRDREGRGVAGALLSVTPWMPTMGHGVWEKPVVKESGEGHYHVDNIVIIMGGLWELRVALEKGELRDRGAFSFKVAEPKSDQEEPEKPREGYQRESAEYRVPEVTLLNQDGKKVNLGALIDSGKPVVLDFIFTTCTTVCPILSAGFANLRRELGENAQRVQFISITLDPENDRPEQLRHYRERFGGGPGWEFLTGTKDDVGKVLKAFDAFVVDKMSHEPLYLLRAPNAPKWVRIKGLITRRDLVDEYRKLENR